MDKGFGRSDSEGRADGDIKEEEAGGVLGNWTWGCKREKNQRLN